VVVGVGVGVGPELPAAPDTGWPLNDRATMRVWLAEIIQGKPQPLEDHDELRWVALTDHGEVLDLPWIPADFPIVEALLLALSTRQPGTHAR
jgi:8-oxo-dGTP diphosphatase